MKLKIKSKLINKRSRKRSREDLAYYGKTLKVISCWSGRRQANESLTGFERGRGTQVDSLQLLEYIVSKYPSLDYGTPVDICLVNHIPCIEESKRMDRNLYDEYRKVLYSVDGKKTKNGKVFVLEKENKGFSMGIFDHAYRLFKDDYDYFLFCEDDFLILKNNYTKSILDNVDFLKENELGWVPTLGGYYQNRNGRPIKVPIIIGCNGFTNKKTLKKIKGIPHYNPVDPYVIVGDPQSGHFSGYHNGMEKRLGHILNDNGAVIVQSPTCHNPESQGLWRSRESGRVTCRGYARFKYNFKGWDNSFIVNPRQGQITQMSSTTRNQITVDPALYKSK